MAKRNWENDPRSTPVPESVGHAAREPDNTTRTSLAHTSGRAHAGCWAAAQHSQAPPPPPPRLLLGAQPVRFFLRAPLPMATKPVLMGCTERRAPQLLHCMENSRGWWG